MNIFLELESKQEHQKLRYFFISAAICSPIFYYFMQNIVVGSTDSILVRTLIVLFSLVGFAFTYLSEHNRKTLYFLYTLVRFLYLGLYLYMIITNEWSVFHRWSYFVVGAILCGYALNYKDYLFIAFISLMGPFIAGFYSPLSFLELIHFHAANLAVFGIIGIPVYSHSQYKSELRVLTKSLMEKSQYSVLGEMASGISHEINSPLMIFHVSLDLLKRQMDLPEPNREKIKELTEKMDRMIERITNIIRSLKTFSRVKNEDKNEDLNLVEVIEESVNLCHRKFLEGGVNFNFVLPDYEVVCSIKKYQIIHALMNLYNNAYDDSLRGEQKPPYILLKLEKNEEMATITISDSGPGVSEEIEDKIFLPFFTTKETGKGVGLGLSVTFGIISDHGGEIYLDRHQSPSTFVMKLPLAKFGQQV